MRTARIAGVSSQKLRYIDLLLIAPWTVEIGRETRYPTRQDRRIQLPAPASFLAQKVLIRHERDRADRAKDLLYIHDTIQTFGPSLPTIRGSGRISGWGGSLRVSTQVRCARVVRGLGILWNPVAVLSLRLPEPQFYRPAAHRRRSTGLATNRQLARTYTSCSWQGENHIRTPGTPIQTTGGPVQDK